MVKRAKSVNEGHFSVEKILEKRTDEAGQVKYLIKWKGYNKSQSTWEPLKHLDCPNLLTTFENGLKSQKKQNSKTKTKTARKSKKISGTSKKNPLGFNKGLQQEKISETSKNNTLGFDIGLQPEKISETSKKNPLGFERGLQPEKIIGISNSSGFIEFLMKWKDSADTDLVPVNEANIRCPQVVIQFYQEHLTWKGKEDGKKE